MIEFMSICARRSSELGVGNIGGKKRMNTVCWFAIETSSEVSNRFPKLLNFFVYQIHVFWQAQFKAN